MPVETTAYRVEVGKHGRMTLPSKLRRDYKISEGDSLTLYREENGDLKIVTIQQQLEAAREILRQSPAWEKLSVDDFIRERRLEAKKEMEEYDAVYSESSL